MKIQSIADHHIIADNRLVKSRQFNGFNSQPKRSFGLETGALRSAAGILNVKGHMGLSNGMTLGGGIYSYNIDDSFISITGETIALIGTKYFNNRAFSQGAYTRLELGMVSLTAESTDPNIYTTFDLNGVEVSGDISGIHARANMGYQWQWSSFYTQAYAGLQYISLSMDAVEIDGTTTATEASASSTAFDLGFNMGVAF
jgi:hypothetical protein